MKGLGRQLKQLKSDNTVLRSSNARIDANRCLARKSNAQKRSMMGTVRSEPTVVNIDLLLGLLPRRVEVCFG